MGYIKKKQPYQINNLKKKKRNNKTKLVAGFMGTCFPEGKVSKQPSSCESEQLDMQPRSLPLCSFTRGVRQLALKEGVWLPAWNEIKLARQYVLCTSAV